MKISANLRLEKETCGLQHGGGKMFDGERFVKFAMFIEVYFGKTKIKNS